MNEQFKLTPAQQMLVERYLYLVDWVIYHYINMDETVLGLGYEDLHQEGSIGLCRAAAAFKGPSRAQFSTFAVTVIRNHLLDHCRVIQSERKNFSISSLDAYSGEPSPGAAKQDDADSLISDMAAADLLAHFKRTYKGTARLGIEALEYKVMGYSGSDIARMYHTKPNYIGACIARAVEKLRRERVAKEFYAACVEKRQRQS